MIAIIIAVEVPTSPLKIISRAMVGSIKKTAATPGAQNLSTRIPTARRPITTVIPITDAMPAIALGAKPCSPIIRGKLDSKPVRTITVTNITAPSSQNLLVRMA